jgi:hypothetical protein
VVEASRSHWRRSGLRFAGLSGVILVTAGALGAEPHHPGSVRRPWRKAAPHAALTTPVADSGESSAEPVARDPGFQRRGFFTRLALGSGVFTAGSGSAADSRRFLGVPVSFEAYLGGTPSSQLSLGAGYGRDAIGLLSSSDEQHDGDEPRLADTSFYLEQLAAFLELYPSPSSPYYGFATLGIGTLNVRKPSDPFELPLFSWLSHLDGADPSGFIVSLGGGYERWIGESWAVGISGRVLGAFLTSNEVSADGTAVTVIMPSVLVTLSYH